MNGIGKENTELNRLLSRIEDWTGDLLLRGTSQFVLEDAKRLEMLADEAQRLDMDLLEDLLRKLGRSGEQSRLATSDIEKAESSKVAGLFFRLCSYIELARQSIGGSEESVEEEESEVESAEEDTGAGAS
ncbi:hypothetical protein [Saccharibacillus sacchari]|uniref:Uncharacterized protein n=1 Tax=Saccharibacillus sacchari TaxID=456493 RepID=A0ACC6PD19_9BACL